MKKALYILLASMMLILTLSASGIAYAQSPAIGGIEYTNQILGFSLTLPASWAGRYSVIDGAYGTTFAHTASRDAEGLSDGMLFYIVRFDELPLPEGALGGAGERHLAAQAGMLSYILAQPSGVEYRDETAAEYQEMRADVAAILPTVNAIPITGAADPTYRAIGKTDEHGLTDNYIYTFAKGAKDAAPHDCLLMINGQFTDWPVIIRNNRALVPLSAAQEAFDTYIFWDYWDNKENISITRVNNTEIKMTVGQTQAYVNGQAVTLDAAPVFENDTVYLPLRFLGDYLDRSVGYLPAAISDPKAAAGLAYNHYNPVVWIDDPQKTVNGQPTGATLAWLQEQMRQGLSSLKDNLDTAHSGYLQDTAPNYWAFPQNYPAFAQIEAAIDNTYYIGNVGRYALFQGPYITLVDIDAQAIYFYTIAHELGTIWQADMSAPDTFVPMYFAD